jgi:hypothetical protein
MNLYGPLNTGSTTGGAGVSTANASSPVRLVGRVQGIYVKYNGSPPAGTTDVTVKTVGASPAAPSYNLLVLADAATDGWFYPRVQVHTTAGAAIAAEYTPLLVYDYVNVTIAQADDADSADIWILLDDYSTDQ